MKRIHYLISVCLSGLVILMFLSQCTRKAERLKPDPEFSGYITSYTSGEISSESPVVIRLNNIPPEYEQGRPLPSGLIKTEPAVKGETLLSSGEIILKPSEPLASGTMYTVTLFLEKLMEVEKPFRKFVFHFKTITQNFSVEAEGLHTDPVSGPGKMSWKGTLLTADIADPDLVEKLVSARYDGQKRNVVWAHSSDRKSHQFFVDSLFRDQQSRKELILKWDGNPLKVKNKGELTAQVPARDEFVVLDVKTQTTPEQKVIITFSDPVAQDLSPEGMVEFDKPLRFTWQVDGNVLTLWPGEKITGEASLTVYKGIRNIDGRSMVENGIFPLNFNNLKPEVRFLGKGVIVPDQGSLSMPFEAVSLKAIDLRIIKIYASNIRQFLQENQIDGDEEINRVGRLVYSSKIDLKPEKESELFRWSTYRINLDKFIKPEQGAVYRIELRFRKAYSLYGCPEGSSNGETDETAEEENWDNPGWYSYYYWPEGYNWQERENPCDNSYYTSQRFVSRNIYASDLGLLAKEGSGFRFTFVVTNLNTALPEEKTGISVYDYQHQLMASGSTDKNGMVTLVLQKKPFVALAAKGNQTGYLRLDDGSSLSLSNFDVSGDVVQEGVKGFIYGERGVWRPGDRLCLTFILDDPADRMPGNTPVILRLINSRGQEVEKRVLTSSVNGFYHFPIETHPDDPTGNWTVKIQAGGAVFEKRIKIETVKPNRLKINLRLPDPVIAGSSQQATLESSWLHGANAGPLKTLVETEMFPMKTTFKGYEKFSFDNPGVTFYPYKETIFEGRLDDNGKVIFPLNFPVTRNYAGKLKAWFTTRVFEEGGDFSINVQQAEFSPYKKYLGIRMPEEEDGWYSTGKSYQPELVALRADGSPLPVGKVEVMLYKINWRWWWESGDDFLAHYVSGNNYQPLKTWSFNSGASLERLNLTVEYTDWRDNGRYLLYARDTENGHATGVTFYMSEWGGWRSDALPEGATILSLRADKEKYRTGEKIRITMPSSASAQALVSLEDGRQVRDIFWVKTTENETSFEVEVKPGMAPTLYVHVSLIQPYGSSKNDAPIRLYGVLPVEIEDHQTLLSPVVKMADELEPDKDFTIKVSETSGKAMTYTVAVVDEGLLDLTGFPTPDPHSTFYAREALGVKTYDLFDYVAGAYGARLEKAFAVGGDQDMPLTGKKEISRFQPVVLFAGPFTLGKGATGTHTFRMPSYVGSVRTMVVAGQDGSYGHADKAVKVRKAVMLLATLPRVAGPGEEISLPVEVFAMKETTRDVQVKVSVNDRMTIVGGDSQTITFSQPGDQMVRFRLKSTAKTGIATVKVTASAGNETAVYEVNMEVRNPNPPVITETSKLLNPGESWDPEVLKPGMEGTNTAFLELSTIPGLNLARHLQELISYPHGCAEQTVSTGLSQLFLENLTELSASEKQCTEENIKAVIKRLQGMQTGTGGFSYWPGQNSPDDWCSSYAGHFMVLSEQKGYTLPAGMKKLWLAYQVSRARSWKPATGANPFLRNQEALIQAYRLFTLALAGAPEAGIMNRFREEITGNPQARWRLAAAYLLAGQPGAANQLLSQVQVKSETYPDQGTTFGCELRDKAMILETLIFKNDRQQAFPLAVEMAGEIGKSEWLSTQTAAWCFYSLARLRGTVPGSGIIDAGVTTGGKTEKVHSGLAILQIPLQAGTNAKISAGIQNNSSSPLYVRLVARGIPLEDQTGEVQRNLGMTAWFTGRDGLRLDPATLPQGTDLFLNITITHPGTRGPFRDIALTTTFPSGWEILNSRINDLPVIQKTGFDYQDIRDDKVYTYFSLGAGQSKSFRIALHAAYAGRFRLPAIIAEAMYDNSVYARIPGQWVTITRN